MINIKTTSVKGGYHFTKNADNEDAVYFKENPKYGVISLADGASDCKMARIGAEVAAKSAGDLLLNLGNYFMDFSPKVTGEYVLKHTVYDLNEEALKENMPVEEYSSTLSCVLYNKKRKKLLTFHIGDSIIMAITEKGCEILEMPMYSPYGTYVTTTENAESIICPRLIDAENINGVIICSDGAWKDMFMRGKLRSDISFMLVNSQYDRLEAHIKAQCPYDDSTFILMDIK